VFACARDMDDFGVHEFSVTKGCRGTFRLAGCFF
jgi:hypothetical protein